MDHENYHALIAGECSTSEAVKAADILNELEEDKREAFGAWVANGSGDMDSGAQFEEAYSGEWDSFRAYSDDYVSITDTLSAYDDFGRPVNIERLTRYFDFDAFARDLEHDYWTHDTERGTVLVFNANV
jgi:antirestriction protein